MMCTTVLHGGVCHRTSNPHKSGNKMTEKKKKSCKEPVDRQIAEATTLRDPWISARTMDP